MPDPTAPVKPKRVKRVTAKTEMVDIKPTLAPAKKPAAPVTNGNIGSILIRQGGFETIVDFDHIGDMRKAWNDIAMRVQNGQSVQIANHIFVGALQASIIDGQIPETRSTRKARRKQQDRARRALKAQGK